VQAKNEARLLSSRASGELTIAVWAQTLVPTSANILAYLGSPTTGVNQSIHTSGGVYHNFNWGGNAFNMASFPETPWQFLVATWSDGGDSHLYVNGELVSTFSGTVVNPPEFAFQVGYSPVTGWVHRGPIGEVAFFDRALDASEIQQMYEVGSP